jgi:hypothetical protein
MVKMKMTRPKELVMSVKLTFVSLKLSRMISGVKVELKMFGRHTEAPSSGSMTQTSVLNLSFNTF